MVFENYIRTFEDATDSLKSVPLLLESWSPSKPMDHVEIIEAEGHLVDSQILSNIMDRVIECGAVYEVIDFKLGRTNDEFSQLQMRVIAPTREILDKTLEELVELGCYQAQIIDATLKPAPEDRVAPDDFYSTTNHRTFVRVGGAWVRSEEHTSELQSLRHLVW